MGSVPKAAGENQQLFSKIKESNIIDRRPNYVYHFSQRLRTFLTKAWEGLMKWLIIFLLFVFSAVSVAVETESIPPMDQKPVAKQMNFSPDSNQAKVEVFQLGHTSSALELMFSSGLRLEIEDIEPATTLDEVAQHRELDRVRLYGVTWQPASHLIGIGIETEVINQGQRKLLKSRPSLRLSKRFERDGWQGSFFFKPLWDHEESNPLGFKAGVRIDF